MENDIMNNEKINEINFIDILSIILHNKRLILFITTLTTIGIFIFSIISLLLPSVSSFLPNVYSPKATMLINNSESGKYGVL